MKPREAARYGKVNGKRDGGVHKLKKNTEARRKRIGHCMQVSRSLYVSRTDKERGILGVDEQDDNNCVGENEEKEDGEDQKNC